MSDITHLDKGISSCLTLKQAVTLIESMPGVQLTLSEKMALSRQLEDLAEYRGRSTNRIVSKALGMSCGTYERLKVIDNAARDENPDISGLALRKMAQLDAGTETINNARLAITQARKNPAVTRLPTRGQGGWKPNHLKTLTNIANTLSGFSVVLNDIESINNTVSDQDAKKFRTDLDLSIRSLNRILNLLKEV